MNRRTCATLFLLLGLAGSALGQELFNYTYEIRTIDAVNSAQDDYGPALSKDRGTLLLTSTRAEGTLGEADIFSASRVQGGYGTPVNPGSPLNSSGNDGAVAIAADGKTVVFSADDGPDGKGSTDLYIAEIADGRITNIRNLGEASTRRHGSRNPRSAATGKRFGLPATAKGDMAKPTSGTPP
ncbi:MAG: PD40 domain-containing protein [Chlorobi bacterium]|nr:PD40 domain-containing protein [Chlorobiota bacterium]